jgi:chromatin assembly factor 1 subunit B
LRDLHRLDMVSNNDEMDNWRLGLTCFRSNDGLTLLISSSDGFCSTLSFTPGELGALYTGEVGPQKHSVVAGTAVSSTQNTPIPTPTSVFAPPSPFPNGSHHRHRDSGSSLTAPSPPAATLASFVNQRPASPARSNSTSSIITQPSQAGVITNPSLIVGQVPGLTATNSGKVTGVPLTTPPETPRNTASVPSGVKREASETEPEDGGQPKKRRIAPTLISADSTATTDRSESKP